MNESRNIYRYEEFKLTPINNDIITQEFDCNDDDLNDFFRNDIFNYEKELISKTYYLSYKEEKDILALISYCNDSIKLESNKQKRVLPNEKRRFPAYPAVKITRLGIQKEFQGNNLGSILIYMTKMMFVNNNRTGCRFITVDAYNKEKVIKFYEKNDFNILLPNKLKENDSTIIMYTDLIKYVKR